MPKARVVGYAATGTPGVTPHCRKETMVMVMAVFTAEAEPVTVEEEGEVNSVEAGLEEKVK